MALSRSMKNLMHDSAQARRGGGNPDQAASGRLPGQAAGLKTKVMQAREGAGGGLRRAMERGGVMGGPAGRRGPRGPVRPTGGGIVDRIAASGANRGAMASKVMDRFNQARGGKPTPGGGTFGFAAQRGGTPALPGATSAADQSAKFRAAMTTGKAAPAGALRGGALAKPRGQSVASRVAGRQGPPARRGGMARALGSGGSRRRMLR